MEKFEPTSAQIAASLLARTGESVVRVVSKTISVRFPIHLLAQVDAMAKISGKSRSLMLFHIVESGVEEIRRASQEEINSKIDELAQVNVSEFLQDCDTKNLES